MAADAILHPVRTPQWDLFYKGVNITARISPQATSVTYISQVDGASSELEVVLEDRDKRWQGPWYPQKGDLVNLMIGYAGEALKSCGDFQVDELELIGPPDAMKLKCVAAFITPDLRTPKSIAWEGQTLTEIAGAIARAHNFTLVDSTLGIVDPEFKRISQNQETDLAFLKRIANDHGYDFTIKGRQLIFYARAALESAAAVLTLRRQDIKHLSLKDQTHQLYKACRVSYQDPTTKQLITAMAEAPDVPTGDTLPLTERVENGTQAELRAQAALHAHNMLQTTGTITAVGDPRLAGGNNFALTGFGKLDGTYLIDTAHHKMERPSAYETEVEVRRVG